ncbi:MAG TPA: hypothetical protein VJO33_03310, partial [Gemmatimonadaceae bacterium]|nr:hypothetical protein [Gemmatimonadaceae bacterium]
MNGFLSSIGYDRWILPALLVIPMAGALLIWVQGALASGPTRASDQPAGADEIATGVASAPRVLALLTFLVEFVVSLGLWWAFDPVSPNWQFAVDKLWIPAWGVHFAIGIDGMAMMMILLTTFIMVL